MLLEKFLTLSEGRRRGWIKPNHKYIRRTALGDGSYKYVYSDKDLPAFTKLTKKDDWMPAVAQKMNAQVMRNISLNKRAASTIAVDADGIVVIGAENLLGRHYTDNKKFIPMAERNGKKPPKGTAYKGIIHGYTTANGNVIPDTYVYPVESVEDKLALEAQKFENIGARLALVHNWADAAIRGRTAEPRQTALAIKLMAETKMRVGGSGGASIPKEIVSEYQKKRKEFGWTQGQYRDAIEEYRKKTFGIVDLCGRHVAVDKRENGEVVVTLSTLAKAAKEQRARLTLNTNIPTDAAYLRELELRAASPDKQLFSSSIKNRVSDIYKTLADATPHTERHAHARKQFVDKVLSTWKLNRRFKTKTAARTALREMFYRNISVPLGHENKTHTVSTALNTYVGFDMKIAYEGLLMEIDKLFERKLKKPAKHKPRKRVKESAATKPRNYVEALASLLKLAAVAKDLPTMNCQVVFV